MTAAIIVTFAVAAMAVTADPPNFRLDVEVGSVFAPNARVMFTIQGCDCSAASNYLATEVDIHINGAKWRTLASHATIPTCECLPPFPEGQTTALVEVKHSKTGVGLTNATMFLGQQYPFFYVNTFDFSGKPVVSAQSVYPTIILNFTTPKDQTGRIDQGWVMQPTQLMSGRVGKFQVPELPDGTSVSLGEAVRVTAVMGLVGEIYPQTPLPVDPGQPADFALNPYYTAAGPEFAGAGTILTITGSFLPKTNHVALLLPASASGTQLTTRPAKSNAEGTTVFLEVPAAIDDLGLVPGEFNILLQELRYTGENGKDHIAQMGRTSGPFVFKYKINNKPPTPPPTPSPPLSPPTPPSGGTSPIPFIFAGIVLAMGTGLFVLRSRRRQYNEIRGLSLPHDQDELQGT